MRNDSVLVAAVLGQHEGAFEKLVESYQKLVWQIVFRMVQDPETTEDLCQEVFLRAHLKLKSFRFECSLATWIGRIAYNRTCRFLQKRKRQIEQNAESLSEILEPEDSSLDLETALVQSDLLEHIHSALEKLPPLQQMLMSLYYSEDLNIPEISGICKLPEGTVKNYLFRSRNHIRKELLQKEKERS